MTGSLASMTEAVRQTARTYAPDFYLSALLAPRARQADLVTLAAYYGDIARIALSVSEGMLGEIRLQWWREALETMRTGLKTGNPVADALIELADRRALPKDLVLRPLAGRADELDDDPLPDDGGLESYFDSTEGAAFDLAARVLGVPAESPVLRMAGRAYGRARLALRLPLLLAKGRLQLPLSRFDGRDPRHATELDARSLVGTVTRQLAKEAREMLGEVRPLVHREARDLRTAVLPLALVGPYFAALEGKDHDPLRQVADLSPVARMGRLWLAKWWGI
jgi:phytoene synthase